MAPLSCKLTRVTNQLLDKLDWITAMDVPATVLDGVPRHRIMRLKRHGERYYADGMRDLSDHRRLAILAVCMIEWRADITDAIVETHDRIVGKLYRASERIRDDQISAQRTLIQQTLQTFANVGASIVAAREAGESIDVAIEESCGWEAFDGLVESAVHINAKVGADPLDFVNSGYHHFRRYTPRLLNTLSIKGSQAAAPLLKAIESLKTLNQSRNSGLPTPIPTGFARPKWRKRLRKADRQTWETAILFTIRDAFRAGDIWLNDSRCYAEPSKELIPIDHVATSAALAVPLDPREWLAHRKAQMASAFEAVKTAAQSSALPNELIKDGKLQITKIEKQTPDGVHQLLLDLYRDMPPTRITDLLLDVDRDIGFSEAFTDIRTGVPCRDQIGQLTVLLSDGVNMGLGKMAEASTTHSFWELLRIARWHVQEDAYQQALAMVVEAQGQLPMAQTWGSGLSSSADGQFFPAAGPGEAMNVVNQRYGMEPGIKAYTHPSDQFAPFGGLKSNGIG